MADWQISEREIKIKIRDWKRAAGWELAGLEGTVPRAYTTLLVINTS